MTAPPASGAGPRRLVRRAVALALTCLGAAGAGSVPAATTFPAPAAAGHWQNLLDRLQQLQSASGVGVLVLVILDGGRPVLLEVRGRDGAELSIDTPFRWGSISKTVTALTLLEAARLAGRPLETPVTRLLDPPPYRNPWAGDRPLRLGQLLELSAGLPDLTAAEFADNQPRPLAEALARGAGERVLRWPPGLQHSYSNAVPGISAAVIEALSGQSFEAAARSLVFEPLGMSDASFQPRADLPGGYRADGRTPIPYWHMTFTAFGALNASPAAMARLLQALLVPYRPGLPADTVARAFRMETTLGARAGLEVGYGAGVYGWVRDGHLYHGHGGDADGYLSRFGLLRSAGRGYLLGINADDPALFARLRRLTEAALSAGLSAPAAPPAAAPGSVDLGDFAGWYYPASTRFALASWLDGGQSSAQILVRGGQLEFRRGDRVTRLLPVGAGRFRRPGDPAVSVVFTDQDGYRYLQGELGNFARLTPPPCPPWLPRCDAAGAVAPFPLWPSGRTFGMVEPVFRQN